MYGAPFRDESDAVPPQQEWFPCCRLGRPQGLPYASTCDLLRPDPRAEGAPNGSYGKDEIEPGRLAMAAPSIRSVRLSLTNSEENDRASPGRSESPFCALRVWAKSACGGIGAVPPPTVSASADFPITKCE